MLPPAGVVPWNTTLCRVPENCHVTVPPVVMVTSAGLNVEFGVVTVAADPAGGVLGGGVAGGGVGVAGGGDPPALLCTTIVPRMPLSRCLRHSKLYVPVVVNVRDAELPSSISPRLPPGGAEPTKMTS
jgi:hypothetical protein